MSITTYACTGLFNIHFTITSNIASNTTAPDHPVLATLAVSKAC